MGVLGFLLRVTPLLSAGGDAEVTKKLVAVLKSDASFFDKAKACQQLAVHGTADAVPVLAGLLSDEKLAHYARFGLEPLPDPSVDEALRAALGELKGPLLVGVINSIGVRRDEQAIGPLKGLLWGADAGVAGAAAASLGRIGTPVTARILKEALASVPKPVRAAVADACLPCAEILLESGPREEAVALYDAVRKAKVPKPVRMAALRGSLLARGGRGARLLGRTLKGKDADAFALALTVAREMPGSGVTRAMVEVLGDLRPDRKVQVIGALGDRGDEAALPAVLEAAEASASPICMAGVRALEKIGGARAVPVLLKATARADAEVTQAALSTLKGLRGEGVDEAIAEALDGAPAAFRVTLIEIAGQRRITSALPALWKAADAEDASLRLAAIRALGRTIGLADIPILASRVIGGKTAEETTAAREALETACGRMPDRDACTEKLLASMASAPVEAKCRLLEVFPHAGGSKALEVVCARARDPDETIRDAATRVLAAWRSEDAVPALLELARTAKDDADRMRALKGLSGLVRQLGFPNDRKLAACRRAMELAKRDEEHEPIIRALAAVRDPASLAILAGYLTSPALKEQACAAAVTVGEGLVRTERKAVLDAMKQVVGATENNDVAARAGRLLRRARAKR